METRRPWLCAALATVVVILAATCRRFPLALGQGADEFLGTQGDRWDTQSDMFCALLGAAAALLLFSRAHDRQIAALGNRDGIAL
jgi:uncharacterized membrane protein YjdF